ncbi:MAG: ABC transporter permease [Acidimicrobiia bacterium]|nr:ABC transporter permease [Acidimicrobiia bacterium]
MSSSSSFDSIVAIVKANMIRLRNERSNLFFLVVLPLMIVFALGLAIGGEASSNLVGVVDPAPTEAGQAVLDAVEDIDNVTVRRYESAQELRDEIARRAVDVGWVAEPGQNGAVTLRWYATAGEGFRLREIVENTARTMNVERQVVQLVTEDAGVDEATAETALAEAAAFVEPTKVDRTTTGDPENDPANIRAVLAAGQLTLFIFLSSLVGASYLLSTRLLGVTRRTRAGPVPVSAIIAGEGLSRFLVALLQAGIVFFGSWFLFGVDWKAPWAVLALSVGMALVGSGGAMLLGTLARTDQQVSAIGLLLGLVLAALGGSMQPLQFFPDALRRVAFVTPHAWMNDALWRILVDGEGFAQIWPSVAVLAAAGTVLLGVASLAMARSLR